MPDNLHVTTRAPQAKAAGQRATAGAQRGLSGPDAVARVKKAEAVRDQQDAAARTQTNPDTGLKVCTRAPGRSLSCTRYRFRGCIAPAYGSDTRNQVASIQYYGMH